MLPRFVFWLRRVVTMQKKSKSYLVARGLEIYIGLYFIAGAIPKALDIDKFAVQLSAYKVIESPFWLMASALFTLFVEMALGIALLLKLRLKGLTLVALQGLLIFFTALILYAWRVHGLEDCGCFPVFRMPPEVSMVKNILMFLAGCYMGWRFFFVPLYKSDVAAPAFILPPRARAPLRGTIKTGLTAAVACIAVAHAWQAMDRSVFANGHADERGLFAQFDLYLEEGHFNLGEGLYLVPIISMTCAECLEKSPHLNDLVMLPDVPPMVALCYEDQPGDMESFRAMVMPQFALHSLGNRTLMYYTLIGEEPFRLSLVQNGNQIYAWDGYVPEYSELLEVLDALNAYSQEVL